MASVRAIDATCAAVMNVVEADVTNLTGFSETPLDFVILDSSPTAPMVVPAMGISLLLYRVFVDEAHRAPPGRFNDTGEQLQRELPVSLHFLVSAWANNASTQFHLLAGAMRAIEDRPILRAAELNAAVPDTFGPSEDVQIAFADLSTEDLTRLWDLVRPDHFTLSVPYAARGLRIQSEKTLTLERGVQDRVFRDGALEGVS